jgi:hypothetical protein
MAFDSETRRLLAGFVSAARGLLQSEFAVLLPSTFGIRLDGTLDPVESLSGLDEQGLQLAETLRERITYLAVNLSTEKTDAAKTKWAVDQLAREQAFTVLNRLAAIRMAEKRGIVQESVAKGFQSKAFRVFENLAGNSLGETFPKYRQFLNCLFDELAVDLGLLFDRNAPQGLLFPRETAFLKLLELFNDRDLENLWAEDETIGWIYQYYNDPAERKEMRDKSAAPRNSRELAVRNQFFTPRYVVEFLTDNTLGRIWYEMCQGQTSLKDRCSYLVRRPNEIFLKEGEAAPEQPQQDNLSQEELLKQTVYIPHRQLKDPRTILMLDPACGSMHFGLYAFDLFEEIYHEAWVREEQNRGALLRPTGMKLLHQSYADKTLFLADIPRLIIEHNIHGVDIDPRATQIAALSLWLRAHRTWNDQKTPLAQRPRITKSHIVCAEPMPGDPALLQEFVKASFPENEHSLFQRLLEQIFVKMQLAGEAGSLLKIEEEITSAVEEAKVAWAKSRSASKELFGTAELNAAKKPGSQADLLGLDTALIALDVPTDFWESIEERIYAALRDYAEQAETGAGFQRRLFAEDAARGFAFIDVCRKRYDVALMNPPFGEPSSQTTALLESQYDDTKADIDAAFVDRASEIMLADGLLGGIYNRTQFFKGYLPEWRDRNLLVKRQISTCLDLGLGVLDGAMVEAAAYTTSLPIQNRPAVFITALAHVDKENAVKTAHAEIMNGVIGQGSRIVNPSSLLQLPGHRISYWVASRLLDAFDEHQSLEGTLGYARQGLITSDNDRFLRLIWEIPCECLGRSVDDCRRAIVRANSYAKHWIPYAKGGDYAPFFGDIHLAVNWGGEGREICTFFRDGRLASRPQNTSFYFQRALTYTERTASDFSPRVMPDGCIFDCKGPIIAAAKDNAHLLGLLAVSNSKVFKYFVELSLAGGDSSVSVGAARQFTQSIVGSVPIPKTFVERNAELASIGKDVWTNLAENDAMDETSRFFSTPVRAGMLASEHLRDAFTLHAAARDSRFLQILELTEKLEDVVIELYGLDEDSRQEVATVCGEHPNRLKCNAFLKLSTDEQKRLLATPVDQVIGELRERGSVTRSITKMCYSADRWLEVIAVSYSTRPDLIIQQKRKLSIVEPSLFIDKSAEFVSYSVGCAFGRWDIRYATGEQAAPELPDPFAPLPVCPPGQLQNAQGLPARPEDVPAAYPVRIPWDGILVDDPNHPLDLERRVREVIEIIWSGQAGGPTAEAIEHEACEILGVKSLRDYFRKPAGFFADHLKRYSKSRRQAPIYWPLSTSKGNYTLWIYYHRLTDQTLHTALLDFVEPKLKTVATEINHLRETNAARDRLADLLDFQDELKEFEVEIKRIIDLPWKPNLNDGVKITASPFWKLFRLPAWQKNLKTTWQELEKGDYDWAHLAYSIWAARVEEKCKSDRSMAIAHGLEHLCTVEAPKPKQGRKTKSEETEDNDLYPTEDEGTESSKESPRQKNVGRQPKANLTSSDLPTPKRRGRPPKNPPTGN